MFIKSWLAVSVAALAMASCIAANPAAAQEQTPVQTKAGAYCSQLGNLSINAMEYKAKGVKLKVAIANAEKHFEGEQLRHVISAVKAGYSAKPYTTDLQVGTATFDKCMDQLRKGAV